MFECIDCNRCMEIGCKDHPDYNSQLLEENCKNCPNYGTEYSCEYCDTYKLYTKTN